MRIAIISQPNILKALLTLIISTTTITNCSNQLSTLPTTHVPTLTPASSFDGRQAFGDLTSLMAFGPRVPGSSAHLDAINYISKEVKAAGWVTTLQQLTYMEKPVNNIIAEYGTGSNWTLFGAHYDSRIFADHDPIVSKRKSPVPGANDGASGVAILLELARVIPNVLATDTKITLVFFDAEDNGNIDHWDWILGSSAYVASLTSKPDRVIILDMLGDKELQIYQERNSNKELTSQIWNIAADLGYSDVFIPQVKYNLIDDHIPFLRTGIPAVDIIDFN
jgi:glutaminyl-peptide cyclotransferase